MLNQILQGDCREVLKTLPADSVNCCVTSPPYYSLRDYGVDGQIGLEETPAEYVAALVEVFREVKRVLRPDGTCWLNLGDSYAGGGGFSSNAPTTAESKSGKYGLLGALKAGGIKPQGSLKPKDLIGIPWRVAFALQDDGWWLRSDIIWSKSNPMPESVTDRPTKSHEYIFLLTKSAKYFYDADAIREPNADPERTNFTSSNQRISNAEFKNSSGDNHRGFKHLDMQGKGRNKRTVWTVATQPYSGSHFATFPEKLIEPCILAGCPAGGVVLDPFGGSGTTGRVATRLGRDSILIELNPEYHNLIAERTDKVQVKMAI